MPTTEAVIKPRRGFTLIELLVVIAIIAVLGQLVWDLRCYLVRIASALH